MIGPDLILPLIAFLIAGVLGGILLGLIGVGMALVTVPLMIFALPHFGLGAEVVPLVALATSMAVVSVGSVSSVLSHARRGNVDWTIAKITVPASLVGIAIGTKGASQLPAGFLRIVFCLFLLYIAFRMLRGRKGEAAEARDTSPWHFRGIGASIGIAASFIGAGGGVLMVPFLASRGLAMPRAVATSTTIGLPVSVLGAVIYAAQPVQIEGASTIGYLFLPAFLGLAVGSALGAPIGAKLTGSINQATLKRVFAVALLIVAASILLDL